MLPKRRTYVLWQDNGFDILTTLARTSSLVMTTTSSTPEDAPLSLDGPLRRGFSL